MRFSGWGPKNGAVTDRAISLSAVYFTTTCRIRRRCPSTGRPSRRSSSHRTPRPAQARRTATWFFAALPAAAACCDSLSACLSIVAFHLLLRRERVLRRGCRVGQTAVYRRGAGRVHRGAGDERDASDARHESLQSSGVVFILRPPAGRTSLQESNHSARKAPPAAHNRRALCRPSPPARLRDLRWTRLSRRSVALIWRRAHTLILCESSFAAKSCATSTGSKS